MANNTSLKMKKLLFILGLFFSINSLAQFPINATTGTPTTTVLTRGVAASDTAFWWRTSYSDTSSANLGRLDEVGGATIRVGNVIWMRSQDETKWIDITNGQAGGDLVPFYGCVKGCTVTWLQNYDYEVAPSIYYINGTRYESPKDTVTLVASDPTFSRLDAFVLNTSNEAAAITGTPAATPEEPNIDPSTQLQISFALVAANTTSPTITNDWIYREDLGAPTEWNFVANPSGSTTINLSSTNFPYAGTKDIEVTNMAGGSSFTGASGSTVNWGNYDALVFKIRVKGAWAANRYVNIRLLNSSGGAKSPNILLGNGLYGFNSSTTGVYQNVTIPLADFGGLSGYNAISFTAVGNPAGNIGYYIDDIQLTNINYTPPSGTGTVTSFAAGNLSPLFTTIVTNATTSPTLSFVLSNAPDGTVFGRAIGAGSGAPSYISIASFTTDSLFGVQDNSYTAHRYNNAHGTYGHLIDSTNYFVIDHTASFQVFNPSEQLVLDLDNVSGTSTIFSGNGSRRMELSNTALSLVGLTNLSTQDRLIGQYSSGNPLGYVTIGSGLSLSAGVLSAAGGSGTVTSFSFTDANGFDGTVTNSTTTPTLSLTTTVGNTQVMISSSGAITGSSNLTYSSNLLTSNAGGTVAGGYALDGTNFPAIVLKTSGTIRGYAPAIVTTNGGFFSNALVNDFVFRSESARILFGVGTGTSTMAVTSTATNLGMAGTLAGILTLSGSSSGTVTIQPGAAAAGTFNFNLPTTAGTSGYLLTSAGGGSSAMTWTDPASLTVNIYNSDGTIAADRTATLGANTLLFTANSLAGDPALSITSTSTAAASNLQKGINVSLSGANSNASQQTIAIYGSNTHTGTTPINIGVYGEVTGTASSRGVYGVAPSGAGVRGSGTWGVYGESSVSAGVLGISTSTANAGFFQSSDGITISTLREAASTNTVIPTFESNRATTGTAADGIGQSFDFKNEMDNGIFALSNQIISKYTTAANATRTSQFIITGVTNAVTSDWFTLSGTGATINNGNLTLGTAGNKINIATGSNASVGTATLSSGTITVNTTAVTTNSIIFLTLNTPSGTLGISYSAPAGSIVNGTSFVINSVSTGGVVVITDNSTVNWWIVN